MRGRLRTLGLLLALLWLPGAPGSAQEAREAGLDDFAWLTGSWRGPGPAGGYAEIHFMSPEAGVLPSFFRLVQDDRLVVLEAITLKREEEGLFMYVRHFDPALVPLEEGHAIELRLVRRDGGSFVFRNVREGENPRRSVMTRTEDGFASWSELARPDGSADTIRVEYRRIDPGPPGPTGDGPS